MLTHGIICFRVMGIVCDFFRGRSPCMSSCYPLHGRAEGDGLPIHKAEDEEQSRGAAFHISSVDA